MCSGDAEAGVMSDASEKWPPAAAAAEDRAGVCMLSSMVTSIEVSARLMLRFTRGLSSSGATSLLLPFSFDLRRLDGFFVCSSSLSSLSSSLPSSSLDFFPLRLLAAPLPVLRFFFAETATAELHAGTRCL